MGLATLPVDRFTCLETVDRETPGSAVTVPIDVVDLQRTRLILNVSEAIPSNLCTVAVGTETDGSLVCPAQTNSIVAIKPTIGLISRFGIIPISHSQDTAGPMARTVAERRSCWGRWPAWIYVTPPPRRAAADHRMITRPAWM